MILSGGRDGLIAISSRTTGMTVRVISDQQGAPITGIDVQPMQVIHAYCVNFLSILSFGLLLSIFAF